MPAMADDHLGAGQFYGDAVAPFALSGAVLTEIRHASARRLPRHSHELAYFCLLLDGDYAEDIGRRAIRYDAMTLVYHPPAASHRDEIGPRGGRFFSVEVGQGWLERLGGYAPPPDVSVSVAGGDLVWLAARLYREYRSRDAVSPLAAEGLVLEMLAGAARAPRRMRAPAWLARAAELLVEEPAGGVTLDRLATEAGVHPAHFAKVFRRVYGRSVGDYAREERVRRACVRLADPRASLADVALAAGFADQSHFTRVFRRVTGTTPGAYRATLVDRSS
jgi:AraC family transcriptional regulator